MTNTSSAETQPDHIAGVGKMIIPAGMKPWSGGDQAPADWDGGRVMLRSGVMIAPAFWFHGAGRADVVAYTPRPSTPQATEPQTYAEFQQARGRLPDLIEETLSIYSNFMADDDYDAYGCLRKIVAKLETARDFYDPIPKPSTDDALDARAREGDDWADLIVAAGAVLQEARSISMTMRRRKIFDALDKALTAVANSAREQRP